MTDTSRDWLEQLQTNLGQCGATGQAALQYLREHNVKIGLHDQTTGARWTLGGSIQLHPRFADDAPDAPYPLSLIVHEMWHLRQGWFIALSVYGELEAWQAQLTFLKLITGQFHAEPSHDEILSHLMSLPVNWDRIALEQARSLMLAYAGKGYRVDLLPLYPFPKEFSYWVARRKPSGN
jgi:hypothetical protein